MRYKECEYCNNNIFDSECEHIGLRHEGSYCYFCDEQCAERFILEWYDFNRDILNYEEG